MVALLLAVTLLVVPGAQAQTITNIAAANWTLGGRSYSTDSNPVSFELQQQPISIETFVNGSGNGNQLAFNPSACGGQTIVVPGGLPGGTSIASLQQTTTIRIGNTLFFRLSAPNANVDPAKVDSIKAILTTTSGDREEITVFETAVNSGVFIGAIPTSAIPPQPVQGDCRLSVAPGDTISIECVRTGNANVIATARVEILADPFGLFFDSEDGTPIDGVSVTLVDALTGAPARVFADDGVTPWPSTVVSGANVTDGAGNVWAMLPGEYRFPLAPLGQYRLVVNPPAPYSAPSKATPGQLALLRRPDGNPLEILPASFGESLSLTSPAPVRVDVPLDRPALAVALSKYVSKPIALPGEVVFYTVTARNMDPARTKRGVTLVDTPSALLRLRKDSVRIDGTPNTGAVQVSADGRQLTIALGDLGPNMSRQVTYAMTVRGDAPAGQALNKAVVTDSRGLSSVASAVLKIGQDNLAARMTLIGQITDGGCAVDGQHIGVPGVRVVLEDGSFAITDADGRYHFDGLTPGSHVVQALTNTLPKGGQFVDCARSTRSAGSPSSRFVIGQGGSLAVADFSVTLPYKQAVTSQDQAKKLKDEAETTSDRIAAGAETDWLALGDGPIDFLFPALDHNPRAPAVRVVIRHKPGQKVELFADGKAVDKIAFDGARKRIDFDSMIGDAVRLVETGRYQSPYSLILVDEFQDISDPRANLIKALKHQKPFTKVFAVGDDWQSIYRFAGSDITIFTQFEANFGACWQGRLEQTYRCNQLLADTAARFVQRNPAQIRKTVRSTRAAIPRSIRVIPVTVEWRKPSFPAACFQLLERLDAFLGGISGQWRQQEGQKLKVLVLWRYNLLDPFSGQIPQFSNIEVTGLSFHRSKGLEADYTVLLDVSEGDYGVPSRIEDDELLNLVIPRPETYAYAEERRLFYVALTRASRGAFILCNRRKPSRYIRELCEIAGDDVRFETIDGKELDQCPRCLVGQMVERQGRNNTTFYGCNQFPECSHTHKTTRLSSEEIYRHNRERPTTLQAK